MLYINKGIYTRLSFLLCFSHTETHEASPESGAHVRSARHTRALQSLGEGTSTARPHQICVVSFCLNPQIGNLPLNMRQCPWRTSHRTLKKTLAVRNTLLSQVSRMIKSTSGSRRHCPGHPASRSPRAVIRRGPGVVKGHCACTQGLAAVLTVRPAPPGMTALTGRTSKTLI